MHRPLMQQGLAVRPGPLRPSVALQAACNPHRHHQHSSPALHVPLLQLPLHGPARQMAAGGAAEASSRPFLGQLPCPCHCSQHSTRSRQRSLCRWLAVLAKPQCWPVHKRTACARAWPSAATTCRLRCAYTHHYRLASRCRRVQIWCMVSVEIDLNLASLQGDWQRTALLTTGQIAQVCL